MRRIVNQLATDHVITVHEDDGLVFRGDLGKRRLLVHPEITKTQSSARVHVVEVLLGA
jgi:hypothetical protein